MKCSVSCLALLLVNRGIMSLKVSQGPELPQGILMCARESNCQA